MKVDINVKIEVEIGDLGIYFCKDSLEDTIRHVHST